jgi:hypothetical protein
MAGENQRTQAGLIPTSFGNVAYHSTTMPHLHENKKNI